LAIVKVLPEQNLVLLAVEQPARKRLDGRALIALGLIAAD
jgi:hypothetical protein